MQGIRGLLFDKDGTLFDFQKTWGGWATDFVHELAKFGGTPEHLADLLGYDMSSETYNAGSIAIAGTVKDIATALKAGLPSLTHDEIVELCKNSTARVVQVEAVPLKPYFSNLKSSGYILGISTNDAEATTRSHLEASGISDMFDAVMGYDSGFGPKPEPGMQLAFCEATSLKPNEVAMIGDSTHDLIAGAKADMRTIGVLTGMAKRPDLTPYADVVVDHIGLIPELLKS